MEKIMLVWLMVIAGIIFFDQLSKWLTVINLDYIAPPLEPDTIPVIKDVFHFTYVRNPGAAFGSFDEPNQRWIFMSISSVAIVALFVYLWFNRKGSKLLCFALSMIVGGGIGNMIDRCFLKYVIDMLDFRLIEFAIFNVADSFVCVGVGLFAFAAIRDEVRLMKKEKAEKLKAKEQEPEEAEEELENNEENNIAVDN
jgi:signal peptidase II